MLPNRDRTRHRAWHASRVLLLSTVFGAYAVGVGHAQTEAPGAQAGSAIGQAPAGTAPNPGAPGEPVEGAGIVPPALRGTGTTFNLSGELSETYTTNGLGVRGGSSDFISTVGVSAGAHDHTLRFDGDLQYNGYADFYARHGYDRISNYLRALGSATLVPEHLVFRASAFAEPILLNQFGPVSSDPRFAASGANSGTTDVYGYSLSPMLQFRLGDFATSQSTATQSGVFYQRPGGARITEPIPGIGPAPDRYISYGASETITSGTNFSRFFWALSGDASRLEEAPVTLDQATGLALLKYAVTRSFALTARGGYESITSNLPLSRSLVGPIAMGGFQYEPSPDLQAAFNAGTQYNSASYTGNLFWRFGAFTYLTGALTDAVTTPSGQLINNLQNLGVNDLGQFYDSSYAPNLAPLGAGNSNLLAFSAGGIGGTPLNTGILRYRSGTGSIIQTAGRTEYRLTGYYISYDVLIQLTAVAPSEGTSTGASFGVSRNFTQNVSGSAYAAYYVQHYLLTRYENVQGGFELTYTLSPLTQLFGRGSYSVRISGGDSTSPFSGNYSQAIVTVGIRRQIL